MFFIDIDTEKVIQQNDRLRINLKKSAGTNDHPVVTKVEVKPEGAGSFVQVSDNMIPLDNSRWFLDWEYATTGSKVITAKFTFADLSELTKDMAISCISEVDDGLFSSDDDLKIHENDISEFMKPGKTSFKNFHRRAQTLIIEELDRKGFRNDDKTKVGKAQLLDKYEFKGWSTFLAMRLIFESVSNAKDDIFRIKSQAYANCEKDAKDKAFLVYDTNKDGQLTEVDTKTIGSIEAYR